MKTASTATIILVASLASPAFAYDDLPKTGTPMPAADISKAYAGKTVTWNDGQMYWVKTAK